jgi:hypothetical protein
MCEILKHKKITDKQLLYLFNMVIISRIEYRTQITFLSKQDCDNIVVSFRKLFKHKLKMASSMPNAALENHYIYKFRDLREVQKQLKITNFSVQINDSSSLGIITNIRLLQLQQLECLTQSPIVEWPYNTIQKRHYASFLASSISLCQFNNISFKCLQHLHNIILEGTTSIRSLLSNSQFINCRLQLIKHNILFLEQLTFINGSHLCSWRSITKRSFTAYKAITKTPKWFLVVESQILVDLNSCLLRPQFISTHATHFKGFPLQVPILDSRSKEWVGIWSPLLSLSVFGRIIEKHQFTHQVLIQHWVHDYSISNYDEPCLAPCNGCILHTTSQGPCSF